MRWTRRSGVTWLVRLYIMEKRLTRKSTIIYYKLKIKKKKITQVRKFFQE
jgi:UDP-N-acetyl-D-mannosaminuronic acid transferase (WecB/TagA/CpsF family)